MKKFLIAFFVLFFGQFVIAQEEINYNEILNLTTMPNDSEIRQIVDKFNFTPEQKEQIFKETKRQMVELYTTKDVSAIQQRALQGKQMMNSAGLTIQDFMAP